jgi:hypothetical protein
MRTRVKVAKTSVWSEEQAFATLLDLMGAVNSAMITVQDNISALAEQEAEGEVKLPPRAEAWRRFLKIAEAKAGECRSVLVDHLGELFGLAPEDIEAEDISDLGAE